MEKSNLVFVYGTLKQDHGNNGLLNGSVFLGDRVTEDKFVLLKHGCPFLVPVSVLPEDVDPEYLRPVRGELYQIDEAILEDLDRLESNGSFYHRRLIQMKEGETAWAYHILDLSYLWSATLCSITDEGEYQWP